MTSGQNRGRVAGAATHRRSFQMNRWWETHRPNRKGKHTCLRFSIR
jgi:hypothetical protein